MNTKEEKNLIPEKRFGQLIRVVWKEETPFFEMYNFQAKYLFLVPVLGAVGLSAGEEKFCTGSFDLKTMKAVPCKNHVVVNNSIGKCFACNSTDAFKLCMLCRGGQCYAKSAEAKEYCKTEHVVYLAFFPKWIVKVGTAQINRLKERLLEQGALYALIIAKTPDGLTARGIETAVSKMGVKSAVTQKYKMDNLDYPHADSCFIELYKNYHTIVQKLDTALQGYLLRTPNEESFASVANRLSVTLMGSGQLNMFTQGTNGYLIFSGNSFMGEIKCVVGTIALFVNANNEVNVVNLKEFYGKDVYITTKELSYEIR